MVGGGDGVLLNADYDEDGNPWGHLWMQPEQPLREGVKGETEISTTAGNDQPDWIHEPV